MKLLLAIFALLFSTSTASAGYITPPSTTYEDNQRRMRYEQQLRENLERYQEQMEKDTPKFKLTKRQLERTGKIVSKQCRNQSTFEMMGFDGHYVILCNDSKEFHILENGLITFKGKRIGTWK